MTGVYMSLDSNKIWMDLQDLQRFTVGREMSLYCNIDFS